MARKVYIQTVTRLLRESLKYLDAEFKANEHGDYRERVEEVLESLKGVDEIKRKPKKTMESIPSSQDG